jgi:hypothetical protein
MPAMLIGGAILAVVAALIFWPTGDEAPTSGAERAKDRTAAAAGAAPNSKEGGALGGIQPRAVDDPIQRPRESKLNPAIAFPEGIGAAPGMPEPEVVPDFDNVEQEIAYYEKKLEHAIELRDQRAQFVERLGRARERAEQSANPQQELEVFEGRKKIVEDNLTTAQKKVDELEAKLADLKR